MEITCVQMDVLISFYIEGELTEQLKSKVEEHLNKCPTCRAKFNIISSIYEDMQMALDFEKENSEDGEKYSTKIYPSKQYKSFRNNLSAYIDNELPPEENIKIKKYAINNKKARKDLEESYHIRKLMKDSFKQTNSSSKPDFSKKVLKQMELDDKINLAFSPLIKIGFAFVITVLLISSIVLCALLY